MAVPIVVHDFDEAFGSWPVVRRGPTSGPLQSGAQVGLFPTEVLAHFDRVWDRLAELNAAYSDEEIAADIETARRE
ncbi:MAG: hypothetical protein P8X95_19595 [Anaerolineales bacterium]|jgi:hypothetical protein